LQMAVFYLPSHHLPSVCVYLQVSSCYKDTSHIGSGITIVTSFQTFYLCQDAISHYSHSELLRVQNAHHNFWREKHNLTHSNEALPLLKESDVVRIRAWHLWTTIHAGHISCNSWEVFLLDGCWMCSVRWDTDIRRHDPKPELPALQLYILPSASLCDKTTGLVETHSDTQCFSIFIKFLG
jgi:hypothetical protein